MDNGQTRRKVLVIASEADFRESAARLLEGGFQVDQAADEQEGLAMARRDRPDAVLLGNLEPRGTSFRLHQKLRSGWITKHIPLVVVDIGRKWTTEEAMRMEAEDYLAVPSGQAKQVSLEAAGLREAMDRGLRKRANLLREAILDPEVFCVTWEQIPGRGAFEIQQEKLIDNVARAAGGGRVHAISVTDNPGGNPALSTEMLCAQIKRSNMEPLVHLACRDKNRNTIESMLYGVAAEGVRNVLILSGDYPSTEAFAGTPKPVFDLDPPNVLQLVGEMNRGLEHKVMGKTLTLAVTEFFAGACVSPFKQRESEIMGQYAKLKKKIDSGAKFIITQVGYDARKVDEVLQWLKINGLRIPVLANVYVLPHGAARLMNAGGVPGCVVTDKLLAETAAEAKADDKGKGARLLRAAKQYAIAKGMGCAGAHIGGHGISYENVEYVVDEGERLAANWQDLLREFDYPQENGFYFFEKDQRTGLNTDTPAPRVDRGRAPMVYRMSRVAHSLLFNEKNALFRLLRPVAARIDSRPRSRKTFGFFEHLAKVVMFDCMNCGDCGLFDVAYVCPMSQCPKQQRNGPCGGSYQGWCEVYPNERQCIWVQAYDRLKVFREQEKIGDHIAPPCDWALWQTPSWLNFYLGRDHTAKRLGIQPYRKLSRAEKREARKNARRQAARQGDEQG